MESKLTERREIQTLRLRIVVTAWASCQIRNTDGSACAGNAFLPPRFSDPGMHHDTCVTHVRRCMPGSLISGFLWSRCREKHSRLSLRLRNPQFYMSGKKPIAYEKKNNKRMTRNWRRTMMVPNTPHWQMLSFIQTNLNVIKTCSFLVDIDIDIW